MWVAAIDFKKAIDFRQHEAIWRSLGRHSISEQCNWFLKNLLTDQRATVLPDVESDEFWIACETKKRRPLELFSSTRISNWQWRKTLKLGKKRAWTSN